MKLDQQCRWNMLGINSSYSQMMSKGCPITETKRIVFRFRLKPFSVSVSQDPYRDDVFPKTPVWDPLVPVRLLKRAKPKDGSDSRIPDRRIHSIHTVYRCLFAFETAKSSGQWIIKWDNGTHFWGIKQAANV